MSPVSFAEFTKNPIGAIAFIMLGVVGFLYYDSENTKKELIANCKKENEILAHKVEGMRIKMKQSDSLVMSYKYDCDFYLMAIEAGQDAINLMKQKNEKNTRNIQGR
jgi:hypothetical protein